MAVTPDMLASDAWNRQAETLPEAAPPGIKKHNGCPAKRQLYHATRTLLELDRKGHCSTRRLASTKYARTRRSSMARRTRVAVDDTTIKIHAVEAARLPPVSARGPACKHDPAGLRADLFQGPIRSLEPGAWIPASYATPLPSDLKANHEYYRRSNDGAAPVSKYEGSRSQDVAPL